VDPAQQEDRTERVPRITDRPLDPAGRNPQRPGGWGQPAAAPVPRGAGAGTGPRSLPGTDDDPLTSKAYSRNALTDTDGRSYRAASRHGRGPDDRGSGAVGEQTQTFGMSGQYPAEPQQGSASRYPATRAEIRPNIPVYQPSGPQFPPPADRGSSANPYHEQAPSAWPPGPDRTLDQYARPNAGGGSGRHSNRPDSARGASYGGTSHSPAYGTPTYSGPVPGGAPRNGAGYDSGGYDNTGYNGAAYNGASYDGTAYSDTAYNDPSYNDAAQQRPASANGSSYDGAPYSNGSYGNGSYPSGSYPSAPYSNAPAQSSGTYNSPVYNGGSHNGAPYNGGSYNGASYNGAGYDAVGNGNGQHGQNGNGTQPGARNGSRPANDDAPANGYDTDGYGTAGYGTGSYGTNRNPNGHGGTGGRPGYDDARRRNNR
jgi:hypothetical protein